MNRVKKFFNKKRVEVHFKNSGEGVRLSSGEGSSSAQTSGQTAAELAAQALEKRMKTETPQDASKRKIQMIAKRELEEERRKMEGLNISDTPQPKEEEPKELEHSSAISSILFTNEILGEHHARPRAVLLEDLKKYLENQVLNAADDADKVLLAVMMLQNLNKTQPRELAIDYLTKICTNILQNPGDPKFRSVRLANNAYNNKIAPTTGGRTFMEAIGFEEQTKDGEQILVFTRQSDEHLVEAISALKDIQVIPIKVARNLQLFSLKEGQKPKAPVITPDFFNLTTAELKAEQKNKEMQVERMLTLRTKEMRQKDEQNASKTYKYTLIRVRLPGNILMQGVFGCHEPFSAVRVFVSSTLSSSLIASEFTLRDAAGQFVEDESTSLAQLGLAPAALLHLDFTEPIEGVGNIVADEYVELIRELE